MNTAQTQNLSARHNTDGRGIDGNRSDVDEVATAAGTVGILEMKVSRARPYRTDVHVRGGSCKDSV